MIVHIYFTHNCCALSEFPQTSSRSYIYDLILAKASHFALFFIIIPEQIYIRLYLKSVRNGFLTVHYFGHCSLSLDRIPLSMRKGHSLVQSKAVRCRLCLGEIMSC